MTALVCVLLTAAAPSVYAQDYSAPSVSISKEKVKMGGKQYFSHIVLEKQTLYSISKAYGVDLKEIFEANPGLEETGLKMNAVILIPDKSSEEPDEDRRKKKEHKEEDDSKYIIHTVRWYEDLDVIAEKYRTTVDLIKKANNLKGRKLKNRQKLRIPVEEESAVAQSFPDSNETAVKTGETDGTSGHEGNVAEESRTAGEGTAIMPIIRDNTIDVTLMLPLNAQDSTAGSRSNMDFYSGVLLAAKELGDSGINIGLDVFDISGGRTVSGEQVRKSDLVIGPVSYGDLGRLMSDIDNSIYVISPLDHKAEPLAASYRNFIQVPTSYSVQYADLARWIKEEKTPHDSVMVIYEKGLRDRNGVNTLTQELQANGIEFSVFSYSILEGRNILDPLRRKMTLTAKNHLLIASESEAFVNDVIRNINLMIHEKYDVSLYASSKIRGFETIEVENLHNANLHIAASYYIDYDRKDVQDFIMKYRALFNTEPTPFAFQGYDIAKYFIGVRSKYGKAWTAVLPVEEEDMLQSGFKFTRMHVGESEIGYVNQAVRRIVYGPDYSVTLSEDL